MDEHKISNEFIAYAAQLYLPEIPGLDWLPVCTQWAERARDPDWLRDSGISPGWDRYGLHVEYYRNPLSVTLAVAWKALILTHHGGCPLGGNASLHSWQNRLAKLRKQHWEAFLQAHAGSSTKAGGHA